MTREEIVLHLVNHSTYHRGYVGDMLKQVPYYRPANDLTMLVRDQWRPADCPTGRPPDDHRP